MLLQKRVVISNLSSLFFFLGGGENKYISGHSARCGPQEMGFSIHKESGRGLNILNLLSSVLRYRPKIMKKQNKNMIIFKMKLRHAVKHGTKSLICVSLLIWQCQTSKPALPFKLNEGPQCALCNKQWQDQ